MMENVRHRLFGVASLCLVLFAATTLLSQGRRYSLPASWTRRMSVHTGARSIWRPHFAYTQYATDELYLCNALVNFANLRDEGSRVDLVLMVPEDWQSTTDVTLRRLIDVAPSYNITMKWVKPWQATVDRDHDTWEWSLTKMHALELDAYQRVIYFDSDGLMKRPLDHLFLLPEADIAMPRAYWLDPNEDHDGIRPFLSSQLMVVHPNAELTAQLYEVTTTSPQAGYDMEYLNMLAYGSGIVLNHRPTNILSGELRAGASHAAYLGSKTAKWNATVEFGAAHYVHFSDWPLPKPWAATQQAIDASAVERCGATPDCEEGRLWLELYNGFRAKRKDLCGL